MVKFLRSWKSFVEGFAHCGTASDGGDEERPYRVSGGEEWAVVGKGEQSRVELLMELDDGGVEGSEPKAAAVEVDQGSKTISLCCIESDLQCLAGDFGGPGLDLVLEGVLEALETSEIIVSGNCSGGSVDEV